MKVAHVSTFPPTFCGIATYTTDLIEALRGVENSSYELHYGSPGPEAVSAADVGDPAQLADLARDISRSDCDVVSLQHEFAIWGGADGENIYAFLEACRKPIVTTLHTTFAPGARPRRQLEILAELVRKSVHAITLTDRSRDTLSAALDVSSDLITVIPHGVPDIRFRPPPSIPSAADERYWKFCSLGFFRPDKGIEVTLSALSELKSESFRFRFEMAGTSQGQFEAQTTYMRTIEELCSALRLDEDVSIDTRFLSREEQIGLIQNSHAGIFSYQDANHASSGVIPMVMAAGRSVICTPFEFACAKAEEVGGVILSQGFSSRAVADALRRFMAGASGIAEAAEALHRRTEGWRWPEVAARYRILFESAARGG